MHFTPPLRSSSCPYREPGETRSPPSSSTFKLLPFLFLLPPFLLICPAHFCLSLCASGCCIFRQISVHHSVGTATRGDDELPFFTSSRLKRLSPRRKAIKSGHQVSSSRRIPASSGREQGTESKLIICILIILYQF